MTVQQFRDILLTVHQYVYHAESSKQSEYIVWKEVGMKCFHADNQVIQKGVYIKIDFFTKTEFSEIPDNIVNILSCNDEIAVCDVNFDYEPDTEYFHTAILCEII